jgi:hypothetical protein
MTAVELQRGDGPLAARIRGGVVPISETPLLILGVAATLLAGATAPWLEPSTWVLVGLLVALSGRLGSRSTRLAWTSPALLRILEYGAVLVLVGPTPVGYALVTAIAFHHYDIVYRARVRGDSPAGWLIALSGGWELRTAALIAAASTGVAASFAAMLAILLATLFVAESCAGWRSAHGSPSSQ